MPVLSQLSNNESSSVSSWLSPIEQRACSLRQETAELQQINAELSKKLLHLRRQSAARMSNLKPEAGAIPLTPV
jgi:hypothetical protein